VVLGNLNVETQVSISTGWVDPNKDRSCFESVPALAAILPELEAAHNDLITIQVKSSANSEELKKLSKLAEQLDIRHDNMFKGIYGYQGDAALITDDPEEADAYLSTRDQLMPDGIKSVQRSYLDEAGAVALAEGRITDEVERVLNSIPTPHGHTLLDEVKEWIRIGKDLGDVERRRIQLAQARDEETVSGKEINAARRRWNVVAETMLQLISLVNIDEECAVRISQPLKTAEEKADRALAESRARSRAAAEDSEETASTEEEGE
jgi:hypothetical protein